MRLFTLTLAALCKSAKIKSSPRADASAFEQGAGGGAEGGKGEGEGTEGGKTARAKGLTVSHLATNALGMRGA